jgi:hypothetical protein
MAEKKTKKEEVAKNKRVREISVISIILIYILGIAAIGVSAYAFTEKGFVEARLGKVSSKLASKLDGGISKEIRFIDATLEDKVCTNSNGNVKCVKNVSDSSIIKGYTLLVTETYNLSGEHKSNIASTLTVNGSVVNATAGYEFDTFEAKKFGGNTFVVANLVNQSGDTYSLVINSQGNVVYK